ncbi:Homeobox-leucine zipper protein HDG11 [Sesbania bispinosa]|nr:Homeobox-leucine zipper protein HDG11 [Sesbania bispinosa]
MEQEDGYWNFKECVGGFASFHVKKIPYQDFGGVIDSLEGRKAVMKFSHQMVKTFCESLTMSSHEPDFPYLTVGNNNGVRVNVRKSMGIGQPNGNSCYGFYLLLASSPL